MTNNSLVLKKIDIEDGKIDGLLVELSIFVDDVVNDEILDYLVFYMNRFLRIAQKEYNIKYNETVRYVDGVKARIKFSSLSGLITCSTDNDIDIHVKYIAIEDGHTEYNFLVDKDFKITNFNSDSTYMDILEKVVSDLEAIKLLKSLDYNNIGI